MLWFVLKLFLIKNNFKELVVPNAYPIIALAEQSLKIPTEISEMNGERQRRHKEVVEEADSEIMERRELIIGNVKINF